MVEKPQNQSRQHKEVGHWGPSHMAGTMKRIKVFVWGLVSWSVTQEGEAAGNGILSPRLNSLSDEWGSGS